MTWMIQIETNREHIRGIINEKNKKLLWIYYEQQTQEEQIKYITEIKVFTNGLICNLIFSIIILGMYILGYMNGGKELSIFLLNFQIYAVFANVVSIIEAKLSISYHDGVVNKGDLNSNSVYVAKVIYGVCMMSVKWLLIISAVFFNIGLIDYLLNVCITYINLVL